MSLEIDYSTHLIRAEKALGAVYPAMSERHTAEAIRSALEAIQELTNFVDWQIRAHTKK